MLSIVGVSSIVGGMVVGAGVSYLWLKKSAKDRFLHLELEAKAKAKAMEHEAGCLLKDAHVKLKENAIEQESEFQKRMAKVDERNREAILKQKEIESKREALSIFESSLLNKQHALEALEVKKQQSINDAIEKMQNIASYTQEEAKAYILEKVEEQSRADVAAIVRKYEQEAKNEGERKANYILAQATTRYAGDFAGERLINIINLPSDEHKGRIIGKEGRNIKSLEMLLGVDIVVDETPGGDTGKFI